MAVFPGYALIIGVGTSIHGSMRGVSAASADARAVAKVLQDLDQCGYPEEHVTLLCDTDATYDSILQALDTLAARATTDDTIFLFYSGQGQYDENGTYFLTATDTHLQDNHKLAYRSAIRQDELLERLSDLKSMRVLLVLDAGHIAPAPAVLSLDEERPFNNPLPVPSHLASAFLATGEGRVIISASRESRHSYPSSDELSSFGQALLDGLRGEGVPSRVGFIDVFDLFSYVYTIVTQTVRQRYGASQEPELTLLKGTSSFPIARYQGKSVVPASSILHEQPSMNGVVREVEEADSRALLARMLHRSTNAHKDVSFGVLGIDEDDWDNGPLVPKSLPATAAPESVTRLEQRRLEAAMPRSARVDLRTEIRTMVALPNSEGLRKYLPALTESGELIARNDVAGHDVLVAFEHEEWTALYLELVAPDFEIEQPTVLLRVPRSSDSGVATFLVTPQRAHDNARVVVNLFQDAARQTLLDSLTLMVDIKGRNITMFFEEIWQVVTSTVNSAGPARQGLALAGVGQQVVYMNVQNQTVVQGDQYTLSGTFRGSNVNIRSALSNVNQSIETSTDDHQTDRERPES